MHRPPIRTTQANIPPDHIDFGVGQPALDILPIETLRAAAAERLNGDSTLLAYGYEAGDGRFRQALANFLTRRTGQPVEAANLFTTAGASQALELICTHYTNAGDTVFVEEPTYFLAHRIFADHGLHIVGLPIDDNGLIPQAVEAALAKYTPKFLYTIPTYQNPTGVTLTLERRQRLLALSQQHQFLIVADEVYPLLQYGRFSPPRSFGSFRHTGTVLSIGSFSKILAPGLRLGWIETDETHMDALIKRGYVDSGGSLNHFTANLVGTAIQMGLQDRYLDELKQIYASRVSAMDEALRRSPFNGRYTLPDGGFFFWITLPDHLNATDLLPKAHEHRVGYQPGARFSSQGALHNYLRLSFAYYSEAEIEEGIERLTAVFGPML